MPAVVLETEAPLATITLNRPESYNSVNTELAHGLINALDECAVSDQVRAIMITGSGKAFCAGQDLKEVTDESLNPGFEVLLNEHYDPIVKRLRSIEKPIVAAVNGVAAGAGANFALACDIILASESASFVQAFSAIGLIPDSGGTYILPRIVGLAKATGLAMLGEKVPAREAEQMGMIFKWFPDEVFMEEARKIALKLGNMPTKGLALTKKAFNASLQNTFEEQMALEIRFQIEAAHTEDHNEGVSAFVEKRKPVFKGK